MRRRTTTSRRVFEIRIRGEVPERRGWGDGERSTVGTAARLCVDVSMLAYLRRRT